MNAIRMWSIAAVVAMVVVVGAGWFVGIAPKLAEARLADSDRAAVEAANQQHEARLIELERLKKSQDELEAELAALRLALPTDAALPPLIGEINALAVQTGVEIIAFKADEPEEFAAEAAPTPADPGTAQSGTPVAPAIPAGTTGFISVPVQVDALGPADRIRAFIERLQYGERLFLMTGMTISVDAAGTSAQLKGLIYVMQQPAAAAPVAAGTPAAPAATP